MADEKQQDAPLLRSQRTKLTVKDLGAGAAVTLQPEGVNKYLIGRLVGVARGFIERTDDKTGQVMEGLKGEFRTIPSDLERKRDPSIEELESGILWIPDAFHSMVAGALRAAQEKDKMAEVEFAFEISSIRAKNPAGYSWDFKPLFANSAPSRLDALISKAPAAKQLAAPAPENKKK